MFHLFIGFLMGLTAAILSMRRLIQNWSRACSNWREAVETSLAHAESLEREVARNKATIEHLAKSLGEREEVVSGWTCGCGHINGFGLATCAACGRRPGETK